MLFLLISPKTEKAMARAARAMVLVFVVPLIFRKMEKVIVQLLPLISLKMENKAKTEKAKVIVVVLLLLISRALIISKVKDRLRCSSGKVLMTGPYNTHVDKLRADVCSDPELAEAVGARQIIFKTTAAAFSFPTRGIAKPNQMAAQMSATMKAYNLFMVIDESALVSIGWCRALRGAGDGAWRRLVWLLLESLFPSGFWKPPGWCKKDSTERRIEKKVNVGSGEGVGSGKCKGARQ